jgi:hypothetical protein
LIDVSGVPRWPSGGGAGVEAEASAGSASQINGREIGGEKGLAALRFDEEVPCNDVHAVPAGSLVLSLRTGAPGWTCGGARPRTNYYSTVAASPSVLMRER